jgi:AraC family transcriptional regulator of adaptative response/methylated-DNA-[protein]-cysteine methyltransferase
MAHRTKRGMKAMTKANLYTTDEARWRALAERDNAAMDAFIYSVKSTGVYCRPLCGSRLPRHENVSFYNLPAEAERAGFRACKQCKPDQPLIRYTITPTSLGLLLIAANKSGICTIEFGESRKALTERLKQEFPEAKIVPTHMELEEAATSVVSMIDGRATTLLSIVQAPPSKSWSGMR